MIKLSTKGRYGTRLMLNLALHFQEGETPVVLKDVSREEDISIRYLEQIIIPLKMKKLVKSIRGAGGGHILAKSPSQIKLIEIIEALEGPLALVDCIESKDECGRIPLCATYEVWKEASTMLKNYFETNTLQDLIDIWEKKNNR
ncbi:MAG: Rrf2 family transcriptional regulator [Candidatus Aminicenantes bacterium]|nr:Rrf2 family transcriptional regulator [Candidatus Aminicenantes bacterium]